VARSAPVQVGHVLGLRDWLSKPKKKGKAPLLKQRFLKNKDFEGRGLDLLKRGFISSGEYGASSLVK